MIPQRQSPLRSKSLLFLVSICLVSAGGIAVSNVASAEPAESSLDGTELLENLNGPIGADEPASDQCGLVLEDRVGSWTCFGDEEEGAGSAYESPPPEVAPFNLDGPPVSTPGEYCKASVCWTVVDDFKAYVHAEFSAGYNGVEETSGDIDVTWQLVGGEARPSNARIEFHSAVTKDVLFTTIMYNGAHAASAPTGGSVLFQTMPQKKKGPHPANIGLNFNDVNKGKLFNVTAWDHNHLSEFVFSIVGKPGFHYFRLRSPVAHDFDFDGDGSQRMYRFTTADNLPAFAAVSGWMN